MTPYLVDDLIREAKVAIDENVSSTQLAGLGDIDTLTLDEIIRSKVEDAARLVESSAARYLLDGGEPFGGSIEWEGQPGYGAGRTNLPSDFMRLVTFRMSDWYRPVTEAITDESNLYPIQTSRYAGVRGNPERPIVAITHGEAGQQVLEFFSCQAGPGVRISTARYLPLPKVEDGHIGLCPKLQKAVVYRLASMVCAITGASDLAVHLLGTSNELAGIVVTG